MNRITSVVGNHGFTPRSVIALRGLSTHHSRKHQREIPARQRFERAGKRG